MAPKKSVAKGKTPNPPAKDIGSSQPRTTPVSREGVKDIPTEVQPMPSHEDTDIRYSTLYSLLHATQPPLPRFYANNVLNATKQLKEKQFENAPAAPKCILRKMVYAPDMLTDVLKKLKEMLEERELWIDWVDRRHREFATGILPYYTQRGRTGTIYSEKDTEHLVFHGICNPALYAIKAILHNGFGTEVDTCTHPYLSSAKHKNVIPDAIVVQTGESPRHKIPVAVEIKCHNVVKAEDLEDEDEDDEDPAPTKKSARTIFDQYIPTSGTFPSGRAMHFRWPHSKHELSSETNIICQLWMQAVAEDPDLPRNLGNGWPRCPGRNMFSTFTSTMFFVRGKGENEDTFYYSRVLDSSNDPVILYTLAFFADAMGMLENASLNLGEADDSWWDDEAFEVVVPADPNSPEAWSGVYEKHIPSNVDKELKKRARRAKSGTA